MLISLFAGVINVAIAVPLIINHLLNACLECWLVYCKSAVKSAYMGHVVTKKDVTGISRISQNLLLNYAHFFFVPSELATLRPKMKDEIKSVSFWMCITWLEHYYYHIYYVWTSLTSIFLLEKTKNKYTPPPNPQINYINPSRKKRPMGKQEQERGLK